MKVLLRKLAQANTQTGRISVAVIECKLIPNKDQYTKGLAEGITPAQGNGLYYLTIGKNTDATQWIEGEVIDVLVERGNFTTQLGAEIENVAEKQGNVLAGTVSFEMSKQSVLWNTLLKAGAITQEMFAEKMNGVVDNAVAKAEAKIEAKAQAKRVTSPVTTRRDRRSNLDLSIFGVEAKNDLEASVPETVVTTPERDIEKEIEELEAKLATETNARKQKTLQDKIAQLEVELAEN